jgi:ParB family transcriptional regulator, chromosome partitioning protein
MTTSNAASDRAAADTNAKTAAEKGHEKLAEKRRALGRGLESLLPGPRVVASVPVVPQPVAKEGEAERRSLDRSPDSSADLGRGSQPGAASSNSSPSSSSAEFIDGRREDGRPGAAVATQNVLDSLQAVGVETAAEGQYAIEIPLDQILENPHQTRLEFDVKELTNLAGSIQTQGVLQPILVRPAPPRLAPAVPEGSHTEPVRRFVLILGERRFRASKIAGKTTIPAIVKRVSEQQAAEMTLVENLQRQDLDCLEQAAAFANLSTGFKLTQEEIGRRVGVSREQVSNYLRLLKLPPEVMDALRKKELTYSHARLLLSLDDDQQITKVARVVIAKKMSVALLMELVTDAHAAPGSVLEPKTGGGRWQDPNVRAAQRSLEASLGMKVRINDKRGKGKILIEYSTLEDFDRVLGLLEGR